MRLSGKYAKLYRGLLHGVADVAKSRRLTAFWPQVCRDFRPGVDWLYVGQAVNGWGDQGDETLKFGKDVDPDLERIRAYSEEAWPPCACPLGWMEGRGLKASSWTNAIRWLNGVTDDQRAYGWSHRMAWSNLYKIAPWKSGNPDSVLRAAQLSACRRLLRCELEEIRPAAVVVLAGSGWFRDFLDDASLVRRVDRVHDARRSVVGGEVFGTPAALAPHPRAASYARRGPTDLGKRVVSVLAAQGVKARR